MQKEVIKRLRLGWLTASAVGVLLASQASVAQEQGQEEGDIPTATTGSIFPDRTDDASEAFDEADRDGDGLLRWQEIQATHSDELENTEWSDRTEVFAEFDESNDQLLNAEEYEEFHSAALNGQSQGDQMAAGQTEERAEAGAAAAAESNQETAQAEQDERWQQEGDQAVAQQRESDQPDQELLSMSVDDIVEAQVVNSEGQEVGTVSRVVRDNENGDLALVLESGTTLGLGGRTVLMNVDEVSQLSDNRLLWETTLSEEELAEIPEFDDSRYTEISQGEYQTLEQASRG